MPIPQPSDSVKQYIYKHRHQRYVYIPKGVAGPEYGGRLALNTMFQPDELPDDTFERKKQELIDEQSREIGDAIKLHDTFDSFRSFQKRNRQLQKDPDSPHQSDAVKPNQVVLLGKEETDKALRKMRDGGSPDELQKMQTMLDRFKRATDVRENRVEIKKAQKQHHDNTYSTIGAGIIFAMIGVIIVLCNRNYLNEKWSDLDVSEKIVLSLTIICPLSIICLFLFGT